MEPTNKKSLDWKSKNDKDNVNIDNKLQKRKKKKVSEVTLEDLATPHCAKGETLQHLHQNITEIFDTPEEDTFHPFFNISLIDDDDNNEEEKSQKQADETIRITKEQQMIGKLDVIMSTAIAADAAGLSSKKTNKDIARAGNAEYDLPKLRRKTTKEKIEDPLELIGEIPEDKLEPSVSAIKKVKSKLPADSLNGMPTDELFVLDEEDDPNALAKLILQKTGRRPSKAKKKLSDLAKDLNSLEKDGIKDKTKQESD